MKKNVKLIFLIVFIWIALSAFSIVNAASADIVAEPTSVKVGEKVTVTVKVNAAAWNLKVSGSASGKVIGYNGEGINESTTKTYQIDTSKAGTYTVSLTGDVTDQSQSTPDIINKSVSIVVKEEEKPAEQEKPTTPSEPETPSKPAEPAKPVEPEKPKEKSTDAYLSTLGITPKEYDFSGFKKNKMDYSVTIPYDVDSVKVLYKTADSNAKVKVTGNSGFEVGSNNKITIKVTAEDGKTTKTYTIKVTKLAEEEEKPGNIIENEEGLYLTKLYIDAAPLSPEFNKDIYSYTATLNDVDIKELLIETEANNKDAKIEITGDKELVEGENIVNIILTLDGTVAQTVYQVVVTAHFTSETTQNNIDDTNFMGDIIGSINKYVIIAVGIVVLMIIAVIVLVVLLVKENKKLKEEENNEEYNVYQNDETEFENIKEKKETEENVLNETETKNERKRSRREKGKHSK